MGLHAKYHLLLPDLNESRTVSRYTLKIFKYQISLKSVLWRQICSCRQTRRN